MGNFNFMKLTKTKLKEIIKEELESVLKDVEVKEDCWDGGDNLVLNLDYQKAVTGHETVKEPEKLPDFEFGEE